MDLGGTSALSRHGRDHHQRKHVTRSHSTNPRTLVFFIDPIEHSSYPVTETGYAMVYRAWRRARNNGDQVYVVYPGATFGFRAERPGNNEGSYVLAHRVLCFRDSPYRFYRSQRESYSPEEDAGSEPCHIQSAPLEISLNSVDAIVFRQEGGAASERQFILRALQRLEKRCVVYLSPILALHPDYGSKILPTAIDPARTPRTFRSDQRIGATRKEKVSDAQSFIRETLGNPPCVIVKPLHGDNGVGVRILGTSPIDGSTGPATNPRKLGEMIGTYGDIAVQEYLPTVRCPADLQGTPLDEAPIDRRDFGEIRFLLIDGKVPRTADNQPILVARRVPEESSLIADSGISHPTSLSSEELQFIEKVGRRYLEIGVYFGGGDLIRTGDPTRPFLFTDAAQSVCGHAVVTGALNGSPYMIVDQVLESLDRRIAARHASSAVERRALAS